MSFYRQRKNHSFSTVSGLYSSSSPGCNSSSLQNASIFSQETGLPSLSFCKVDWLNSFSFLIRYVEYPLSLRACRTLILNTIPTVLTSLSIVYNHCTTEYERIQVYILNKASKNITESSFRLYIEYERFIVYNSYCKETIRPYGKEVR